jgi:NADPH-dependent curcumin reductase CurA
MEGLVVFDDFPEALGKLFPGENLGKLVLEVAQD